MTNHYLRRLAARVRRQAAALRQPRLLLGATGLLLAFGAQAQQGPATANYFAEDAAARSAAATSPLRAALLAARPLTLDVAAMQSALRTAPLESRAGAKPLVLTLPLPDGTAARFEVREAPVLAPAVAAQFPDIKTYVGAGLDDRTASLRLDLTPRGFHAQVLSATTGDFFIDPTTPGTTAPGAEYLAFWKRSMPGRVFSCVVKGAAAKPAAADAASPAAGRGPAERAIAATLRTYRLALAATAEYTAARGGTVASAQAAMVTSVNRVVGVYEKELDVRLVLVSGIQLIYTNAATDPYTNDDGEVMLDENQANVDALIGNANYDIGHVFSTGGGGIAGLGVVCTTGEKAQGVTGSPSPVGDAFDIDYVAHEMGHQFGANHTFNNNSAGSCQGNRNPTTAFEPGSGATIMAYAGICGTANDLQPNSDAYFHVVSYEEIQTYLASTSCAVTASTGNNPPSVVALPASGKVLPIGTPFKLTTGGYDSDGDALTYCWEEFDLGTAGSPTAAQAANNNVPLFRSFNPTASPTRYFPRLPNLVANTTLIGERLPTVARTLTFRVTLRDQHNGSQGVVGGLNSSPSVVMTTVATAGPFVVTSPNTAVTVAGGSSQAITWNVANTSVAPVSCATVNLRLSTDGGLTYPTVLASGVPNSGTATVTVPSVATTTARVMVEAADNYFFDISNVDFTITAAAPCAAPTALAVSGITATSANVSFTPSSSAASYVVTTTPATTTRTVTASPVALTGLAAGTTYTVSIASNCSASATSTAATVSFATTPPPPCNEVANVTFSNVTGTSATLNFTATTAASNYVVTISPTNVSQTITGTTASFSGLTPGTAYTVTILSSCPGGGQATTTARFGTIPTNDNCAAAVNLVSGTTCVTTSGSVSGATQSQAPSTCSGAASATANDVWYSFVATSASHTVRLVSDFDGVVEVLRGTCGSLTSVQCVDAAGAGTETLALTTLTPNTRYYVRVFAYTSNTVPTFGTFTLCVIGTTVPSCVAPTAPSISAITGTTASLSFAGSGVGVTYTVSTTPATATYTVGASPVALTGLTLGTTYTVSIVTNCANGTTLPPVTTTFVSVPCAAVTNIVASNLSGTRTSVSFTPSSTATTYTVTTTPATTTQTVTASPVTLTGLTPGTSYTVSIVSNCGSGATATATRTFTAATALATAAALEAAQISIAPNPAHDSFVLTLPGLAGQRTVQASLLNVLGQVVAARTIALGASGATAEFDTRTLAKGVYVLRLAAGDQLLTQRVAVE